MQRIILIAEGEILEEIFRTYEEFAIQDLKQHTKKYFNTLGRFYVTKFSPDAQVFEQYYNKTSNPFIQTMQKHQLLNVTTLLSGLNLIENKDYTVVRSRERGILGIVFNPLEQETVDAVIGLIG